jgi:glycosyltransferase involved in cell wall biosynthesis
MNDRSVGRPDAPLDVLIAGWFPAADDPIAGRFIADQAAALAAGGRVRPTLVSFEPFPLQGDLALRQDAVDAWAEVVRAAARDGRAFADHGASGPAGIPVARLGVPHGGARGAGRTNQAIHRATILNALLEGAGRSWPLLHAHVGYPEGAGAASVARARHIPLVLTEHATYLDRLFADPEIRAAYLEGARTAARIVAVSRVLADRIGREFPELVPRIVVIPNTVDVEAFRAAGPAGRNPDELLWVGYRREVKGMPVLLAAFRMVHAARPSARLRLIGRSTTDEEEAEWQRLAAELHVADAVSFEPPADRATVAAAMERAAVFVHASRNETMGIVAVEALAAGLPVVAVDSGGVTEVMGRDPSALGALIPRQDPELLAAAIVETLARRDGFDPLALRAHVVDRYGSVAVAARIADLYGEVLRAAGGRPTPGARLPAAAPAPARPVVVGFDRGALDAALPAFPAWVVRDAIFVTTGPPIAGHPDAIRIPDALTAELEALLGLQGRARRRGIPGLLLAAPRWIERRRRRRRLVGRVIPALSAAIEEAVTLASGSSQLVVSLVVCLGGIDVVAAERLRTSRRIVIAPGGLRWLGDHRGGPETGTAPQAPAASSA